MDRVVAWVYCGHPPQPFAARVHASTNPLCAGCCVRRGCGGLLRVRQDRHALAGNTDAGQRRRARQADGGGRIRQVFGESDRGLANPGGMLDNSPWFLNLGYWRRIDAEVLKGRQRCEMFIAQYQAQPANLPLDKRYVASPFGTWGATHHVPNVKKVGLFSAVTP